MTGQELDKCIETLFGVARLHGWCDQVNEGIQELRSIRDQTSIEELRSRLLNRVALDSLDKVSAVLSLILLHYTGVSLMELLEHTHRHLRGRLYMNDFRFLVHHFLDNRLPLPRTLTYDITERLFFSLESIYDSVVRDFKKVPYRNAEAVTFYLTLQNCRVDLNTQNKELISIILVHIEIRLPDSILDDVIDYLDQNATIGEKWQEQRKTIELGRTLPPEPFRQHKKPPARIPTPAESPSDSIPPERKLSLERPPKIRTPKTESPKEPAAPSRERDIASAKRVLDTTRLESPNRQAPPSREARQPPQAKPESGNRAEAPDAPLPGSGQGKKGGDGPEIPSAEPVRQPLSPSDSPTRRQPEEKEVLQTQPQAAGSGGKPAQKPAVESLQYEEFMEEGRERGILLSKLDQRRWQKSRPTDEAPQQATTEQKSHSEHDSGPGFWGRWRRLKRNRIFPIAVIIIVIVLLLVILLQTGYFSVSTPPPVPTVETAVTVVTPPAEVGVIEANVPAPPRVPAQERVRFQIETGPTGLIWAVRQGDTLYDLFRYLRSPPADSAIDARLRDLGKLSWAEFSAYMQVLNADDRLELLNFDRIYPQETYLLLKN